MHERAVPPLYESVAVRNIAASNLPSSTRIKPVPEGVRISTAPTEGLQIIEEFFVLGIVNGPSVSSCR